MQLIPEATFDALADVFDTSRPTLESYRLELLDEPISGRCLRNYILLTELPELFNSLGDTERFWHRYYWLRRYAIVWQVVDPDGYDPAIEVMLSDLLEESTAFDEYLDSYSLIETTASQDANRQLQAMRKFT